MERRDDVVAELAANENAVHRPRRADAQRGLAALELGARGVGEIGTMPLAGVDHQEVGRARRIEHPAAGDDRPAEQRYVVAQRLPEAARLEEIALHVDDDEGGPVEIDRNGLGLGLGRDRHLHRRAP